MWLFVKVIPHLQQQTARDFLTTLSQLHTVTPEGQNRTKDNHKKENANKYVPSDPFLGFPGHKNLPFPYQSE